VAAAASVPSSLTSTKAWWITWLIYKYLPPSMPEKSAEPEKAVDIFRDDEGKATVDIRMEGDDDARVWISTSADVVGTKDDHVYVSVTPGGEIRITVKKDGNKHELKVPAGEDDETKFVYKLNGEVRPYDDEAKKIFEPYMKILEDGIRLNVKGERI